MLVKDQTIPVSMAHDVVLYGKVLSNTAALATARPTASAIAADTADVAGTAAIAVVAAAAAATAAVAASVATTVTAVVWNQSQFLFQPMTRNVLSKFYNKINSVTHFSSFYGQCMYNIAGFL